MSGFVLPLLRIEGIQFSNKLAKKQFDNALSHLREATAIKIATLREAVVNGMSIKGYLDSKARARFQVSRPPGPLKGRRKV